LIFSIKEVV